MNVVRVYTTVNFAEVSFEDKMPFILCHGITSVDLTRSLLAIFVTESSAAETARWQLLLKIEPLAKSPIQNLCALCLTAPLRLNQVPEAWQIELTGK